MATDIQNNRKFMNRKIIEAYKNRLSEHTPDMNDSIEDFVEILKRLSEHTPDMNDSIEDFVETLKQSVELLKLLTEGFLALETVIDAQQEVINRLSDELYEIAPEKEIIDTMYLDDNQERTAAINRYMNHGNWDEPAGTAGPGKDSRNIPGQS